jgi:hypothetical protein
MKYQDFTTEWFKPWNDKESGWHSWFYNRDGKKGFHNIYGKWVKFYKLYFEHEGNNIPYLIGIMRDPFKKDSFIVYIFVENEFFISAMKNHLKEAWEFDFPIKMFYQENGNAKKLEVT